MGRQLDRPEPVEIIWDRKRLGMDIASGVLIGLWLFTLSVAVAAPVVMFLLALLGIAF